MSIEATLLKQRQEAEALRLKEEEEAKEAERIKFEKEETERGKIIYAQIDDLKSKKSGIEEDQKVLKASYTEAGTSLGDFKKESEKLGAVHKKFETDLKQKGIKDKADLIQSPDFAEDEDVLAYKTKGKGLREKVDVLSKSKEKIKKEIPGLDFRGGKAKPGEKSPREESFEKVASHIVEIEGQIKDLEKDTPERRIEEKRVQDCIKEIGDKVPSLTHIDSFERLSNVSILGYSSSHDRIKAELYVSKYGESAFKEALVQKFSEQVDQIAKSCNEALSKRYGSMDKEGIRRKVEKVLKARINMDVVESKLQNLIDQKQARSIFEKGEKIFMDKKAAEAYLPTITEKRKLWRQDGRIKTRPPYQSSGRVGDSDFEVLSKDYESDEAKKMVKQIEELNLAKGQTQVLLSEKMDSRPMLFGKKEHMAEEQKLKDKLAEINRKIKKLEEDLIKQKGIDSRHEEKLDNLSVLVRNSGLSKEKSLISQGTTIGEFLDEMERILNENSQKELTPEEAEIRQKYYDTREELQKAKHALEDAVRY